jgi:hypothetical protein
MLLRFKINSGVRDLKTVVKKILNVIKLHYLGMANHQMSSLQFHYHSYDYTKTDKKLQVKHVSIMCILW